MGFKINTSLGVIEFGATSQHPGESSGVCYVGKKGTDLVSLVNPGHKEKEHIKAFLNNGNNLDFWFFRSGPNLKLTVSFRDKQDNQVCSVGATLGKNILNDVAWPPVWLAETGNTFASGKQYYWSLLGYFPFIDGSQTKPPYNADAAYSQGGPGDWPYQGTSTLTPAFLQKFCEGSIVPDFPGPDNEKDPEGGDGEGPEGIEDDPIEAPEDPSISAVDSGLLTLYTPTLGQIHEFGNFLWSDLFSLDTFKKLFSDPMQAVIGLSALPIHVPSTTIKNIIIGSVDSGVRASVAAKQFVRKDCGTIHIKPTWNTALDYEPYTKFSIFLPYIGTRELKTDDIMDKDINVSYLIDILSGSCTAHIKVGGSVLYQFSGSCAVPIPVTGTSWNNLLTSCIQLAGAGIVTAASGGAASAALAGGMAAAGTANMVANSKPNIQRTGAVSGSAGMLGVQTPYLIRETPRQSLAKGYNKFVGYPSNITSKLGDLKGYTQVENIHLENLSCTADEAAEIESLLKEGVII